MKVLSLIFTLVISVAVSPVGLAFAAEGVTDKRNASLEEIKLSISPSFTLKDADHVINGIALRNRTSGWIPLRGIPIGSTVQQAFLYYNFSDGSEIGNRRSSVLFDGNLVEGTKTADNTDPCWGMAGNHTYRADVTSLIPATNPNGDYEVVIDFNKRTSTTGQNPWSPIEPQTKRLEGATLVVVFSNESTIGKEVLIYDALTGSEFSGSATFTLSHPALSGNGLFSMSGADGQRGGGHDNAVSNETGTFNGTQFSGPPVAASDWDGSAGWPLPQLWDVHTHIVKLAGTCSIVKYTANGDCLVPVVFILGNF